MNAVDYLLKPVEKAQLRETLNRAKNLIEHTEIVADVSGVDAALSAYEAAAGLPYLERVFRAPSRGGRRSSPSPRWRGIPSPMARCWESRRSGASGTRIWSRLKDLERRLDPARFIQLAGARWPTST